MTEDKPLARVAALLRQAEGTDNPHEAEAFFEAAQRLATAASIDLALARAHIPDGAKRQTPQQRTVMIGERGARGLRTYVALFAGIAKANQVTCDVASNSTYVLAYGFAEDIDAAQTLYASLVVQMTRACEGYLASGAHQPTPKITARLNFQLAFAGRVAVRLTQAREESEKAREKQDRRAGRQASSSTALALRDKELALRDFHREHSKARGSWQAVSQGSRFSPSAHRAGDKAGADARLGAAPQLAGARRALGR